MLGEVRRYSVQYQAGHLRVIFRSAESTVPVCFLLIKPETWVSLGFSPSLPAAAFFASLDLRAFSSSSFLTLIIGRLELSVVSLVFESVSFPPPAVVSADFGALLDVAAFARFRDSFLDAGLRLPLDRLLGGPDLVDFESFALGEADAAFLP